MQASQCTTTPRAGAIFRQKSGRGFLRFSLSLALFPPFPFFRLSLFPPFPLFRGFLKNKSLCGGESQYKVFAPYVEMFRRDRITQEQGQRIVQAHENEDEDYLITSCGYIGSYNRSTARGILGFHQGILQLI